MRICLVYDCLFPWTVGGAERWMRAVGEALAAAGHEVTYLTRRQWEDGDEPDVPGVRVIAVAPAEELYGADGNRTIGQALRFGRGVARHLATHRGAYDVVHVSAAPFFGLLAAGMVRRAGRYRLASDWFEVWSDAYWREYLGPVKGRVAAVVQRTCARLRQEAFCSSRLHAQRLRDLGLRTEPTVVRGMWTGSTDRPTPRPAEPLAVFAGRMIPEKHAPAIVPAVMVARERVPQLRATIFGEGPELDDVRAAIVAQGAEGIVDAPGFVDEDVLKDTMARAACLVLPSTREGYGLVVVEAAAMGVPSVLVDAPDNASTEHIVPGVNGFVCPDLSPAALADGIVATVEGGPALRESTADWFAEHADMLSIDTALAQVLGRYGRPAAAAAAAVAPRP
ncbi:MAG TPA: glycosyltransferase [Baekduia sp.]|uniref:glycosyltransferase family 4 protein n=1 Tax=Baekduia sp. TaxID=2600305 RepID=UPI002BFAD5B1|nr:glycosyltransferase [Baekduia sp.]HMJ36439.1 glycosyltransferase [Baekduia sp.]